MAARIKAWTFFPARILESVGIPLEAWMSVYVYSIYVLLCVGRGFSEGWSPVQVVLTTVCRIKNWKSLQGPMENRQRFTVHLFHANEEYFLFPSFFRHCPYSFVISVYWYCVNRYIAACFCFLLQPSYIFRLKGKEIRWAKRLIVTWRYSLIKILIRLPIFYISSVSHEISPKTSKRKRKYWFTALPVSSAVHRA
jgi:hypothetical protein